MEQQTDEMLVRAYVNGDSRAFEVLVDRYTPILFRFLYRFAPTGMDAEDATQEALIRVWKYISRFDPSRSFRTWLFTIAKNVALDERRKKLPLAFSAVTDEEGDEALVAIPDTQPLADDVLMRADLAALLQDALATLPPDARFAFLLHYDEELTFREIAEVTKEPVDTVKSRVRRASLLLRKRLEKSEDAPKQASST